MTLVVDTAANGGRCRLYQDHLFQVRVICLRVIWLRAICLLASLVLLTACSEGPSRVVLRGATMGTSWSVIYAPPDAGVGLRAAAISQTELQALLEAELLALNAALSTYIPDSEIARLNAASGDVSVALSPRFAEVLSAALSVGALTQGAYDVTVGPLVELWGFGAARVDQQVPDPDEVLRALTQVGAARLGWNAQTSVLERPAGMRIDLSSIAKGYAVDRLATLLQAQGVENALVEIGGELKALGRRPEGGLWRLAVESPDPAQGRFVEALQVSDAAVATSGDYRNFFEIEGKRYSHLVDARTGYPVAHELVSVTVVDKQCMRADALATALIVLGLEEALRLAEAQGLAALFVSRAESGLEVHYTLRFEAYLNSSQRES